MHVLNKPIIGKATKLTTLSKGTTATVKSLEGDDVVTMRLRETGFTPGTAVTMVMKAPFGDPLLYDLRGTRIALRKEEAECINLN